jgi:hypothetical protein
MPMIGSSRSLAYGLNLLDTPDTMRRGTGLGNLNTEQMDSL